MILVCRNNPESHPMLKQLLNSREGPIVVKKYCFNKIYISECPGDDNVMLCDAV